VTGLVQRVFWHYFGAYRVTDAMLDELILVIHEEGAKL